MPEVIIKYKNAKVLEALKDFAKYLDFVIELPKPKKKAKGDIDDVLPIVFAKKPDVTALAGIWKGRTFHWMSFVKMRGETGYELSDL